LAFKEVTELKALKEAKKLQVTVEGKTLLLTYYENTVHAMNDACPHMKASLSKGSFEDGVVTCPKHGAQIDVRTGSILEKAKVLFIKMPVKKAQTYETKVENDKVLVNI